VKIEEAEVHAYERGFLLQRVQLSGQKL